MTEDQYALEIRLKKSYSKTTLLMLGRKNLICALGPEHMCKATLLIKAHKN